MATRFIFPVQVGISLLIFTLCIAIIGCAGHVLSVYGDEGDSNMWWLSLWPDHFAAGPTRALIGSAAAVVVMNTIFLALITLPLFNLRSHPTIRAILLIFTTFPAACLTMGSFIYVLKENDRSPDVDTLHTWTCRAKDEGGDSDIDFSSDMSNEGFGRLCAESRFALYGTVTVFTLQVLILAGVLFGCSAERREKKAQRAAEKELEEEQDSIQLQQMDAMKQQVHADVTMVR